MIRPISSTLLCVLLLFAGCGRPLDYTAPVTGTVTIGGQPANAFTVIFHPAKGRPATGTTDAQGRFTLTTFESGDGAVLGDHIITVTDAFPNGPPAMGRITANMTRVPLVYSSEKTTPLKATVEDKRNEVVLELKR